MAASQEMSRRELAILADNERFRNRAVRIIAQMVKWSNGTPSALVDEILHSIFFLGILKTPPYEPKDILGDDEIVAGLRSRYPRPFDHFFTQLPKRSPFSCVLDMTVLKNDQEDEDQIKIKVRDFIHEVKAGNNAKDLTSTIICISQRNNDSLARYYGVSMSTTDPYPGRIMVAASCLSDIWDSYVADAVMTYYPIQNKTTKKEPKNPNFDGTFRVPAGVRCQAFNIEQGREMIPCKSCNDLFGLPTTSTKRSAHGNCAEPESLSKMLKNEREVRDQIGQQPKPKTYTDANRNQTKEDLKKEVVNYLRNLNKDFKWNGTFYTPQV